jgi:hypothetical protein
LIPLFLQGSGIFEFLNDLYGIAMVDLGDDAKGIESNKQRCLGDS